MLVCERWSWISVPRALEHLGCHHCFRSKVFLERQHWHPWCISPDFLYKAMWPTAPMNLQPWTASWRDLMTIELQQDNGSRICLKLVSKKQMSKGPYCAVDTQSPQGRVIGVMALLPVQIRDDVRATRSWLKTAECVRRSLVPLFRNSGPTVVRFVQAPSANKPQTSKETYAGGYLHAFS